jgi:hypothetical protein
MSAPPTATTVVYYVPDDSYYSRDWRGSDIALVTIISVLLLVTVTCSFAECYAKPEAYRERRRGRGRAQNDSDV